MYEEKRLDILVMEKSGFSRAYAKEIIESGFVCVDNKTIFKPGVKYSTNNNIIINAPKMKYASRGGYKLQAAIECFKLGITGLICGDIGASTGGFTDCMLQYGAKKVYAVDVGTNQLARNIRENKSVVTMENTDIRDLAELPEKLDFIAIDVSFISIKKIINNVTPLAKYNGQIVCLIKPQFEVGKHGVNKNGIVKDAKLREKTVKDVAIYLKNSGFTIHNIIMSPVAGKDGNIEYLAHISKAGAVQ